MSIWQNSNSIDGVDVIDQKTAAYRLDFRSKYRFYLGMFFYPLDVTHVNSHIDYMKIGDDILLLNFKIVLANTLIGRYSNCNRSCSTTRLSKRKLHEPSMTREVPIHMSEVKQKWMRCHYCKNESSDLKSFVSSQTCGLYLCLAKERNYFLKHHL